MPQTNRPHPLDDDPDLAGLDDTSIVGQPSPGGSQSGGGTQGAPKPAGKKGEIRHSEPLNPVPAGEREKPKPIDPLMANTGSVRAGGKSPKIVPIEQRLGGHHVESGWNRRPHANGTGAIHVRSFHCKLTGESLEYLARQINEWLDAHPDYEVKMVTTSVGEWTGKSKEPSLIVNVWV